MLLEPVEAYTLWASSYPPHAHNPLMMAEEQAMLSCLPESLTGLRIFDAGCGSGRLTAALAERLPRGHVVALDRSWNMLHEARSHLRQERQR